MKTREMFTDEELMIICKHIEWITEQAKSLEDMIEIHNDEYRDEPRNPRRQLVYSYYRYLCAILSEPRSALLRAAIDEYPAWIDKLVTLTIETVFGGKFSSPRGRLKEAEDAMRQLGLRQP